MANNNIYFQSVYNYNHLRAGVCDKCEALPHGVELHKYHIKTQMSLISCHALLSHDIPLSASITRPHVAFPPVDPHLPPHFLLDPGHLQTVSSCGLLLVEKRRCKRQLKERDSALGTNLHLALERDCCEISDAPPYLQECVFVRKYDLKYGFEISSII